MYIVTSVNGSGTLIVVHQCPSKEEAVLQAQRAANVTPKEKFTVWRAVGQATSKLQAQFTDYEKGEGLRNV